MHHLSIVFSKVYMYQDSPTTYTNVHIDLTLNDSQHVPVATDYKYTIKFLIIVKILLIFYLRS